MSLFTKPENQALRSENHNQTMSEGPLNDAPRPKPSGEMRDPPRDRRSKSAVQVDLVIDGNLKTAGFIEVSGTITGDITADTLVLNQGGQISGNAETKHLTSNGTISGSVLSEDVTLKSKSITNADISCMQIFVEPGAQITGALDCTPKRKT